MSASRPAAVASDLLTGFPAALREAGLMIDPGRTQAFLRATAKCRLRDIDDLARLGRVTLTGSPEDFPVFDAVFEHFFGEATFAGKVDDPEDDRAPRSAPPRSEQALLQIVDGEAAGHAASDEHLRNRKTFNRLAGEDRDTLARLSRRLGDMPKSLSRKWVSSSRGARIDLAGTARAARRTFGETLRLMREVRPEKPRRLLFLIDVSGSMKAHSELYLRFAQLVTRRLPKVETFCFGTKLSRVTKIAEAPQCRHGTRAAVGHRLRFRRRHADRRVAGGIPVGVAARIAGARRGHDHLLRRAGARRPAGR